MLSKVMRRQILRNSSYMKYLSVAKLWDRIQHGSCQELREGKVDNVCWVKGPDIQDEKCLEGCFTTDPIY